MPTIVEGIERLSADSLRRSAQLVEVIAGQASFAKKIDAINNTMRATANTNTRLATFEADHDGLFKYVNRTFLRWVGLTFAEVENNGWRNAIHHDDRDHVVRNWESAVRDSRRFHERFRLLHSDGVTVIYVDANAEPIPEGAFPAERWVGSLIRTETPGVQL